MNTFFVKAKVKDKEHSLQNIIKKAGYVYPHPSLGFFSTVYAPIEAANGNKVRLSKEAVDESLLQLKGEQINFNHWREGNVTGHIMDVWINDKDEISLAFAFYKTIYPKEYEYALELFDKGELTVSFELRVQKQDIEIMADGTRRLHKVEFDGMGLLMGEKPAYPGAIVFEKARQIVNSIIEQDSTDLVFAQKMAKDCKTILEEIQQAIDKKSTQGGQEMDKKANDALLAVQKKNIIAEFGEEAVKDWSDEDFLNDEKINALRESLKADKEDSEKSEEQAEKEEEKKEAEEKAEETQEKNKDSEEASDPKDEDTSEEQASYKCECLDCGKVFTAQEHCKDTKCPECGGQARRKDRPGPGQKASEAEDQDNEIEEFAEENKDLEESAKWTRKYINTLPNSSFVVIEPAYLKGETDNKNARHLPFKDENGKVDLPHLRNALARANQIKPVTDSISTEELRKKAMAKLEKYRKMLKTASEELEAQQAEIEKEIEAEQKQKTEEAQKRVIETQTTQKVTDVIDNETKTETVTVETESVRTVDGKPSEERKETSEVTYTYAQVEEIKAEYENKLKQKDEEINFLKENARKVEQIRAELGDYVKDLSDEELVNNSDKIENARLKKENDELKKKKELEIASEQEAKKVETGHEDKPEEPKEDKLGTYIKKRYNKLTGKK